ncbi:hypothetical protein BASA82_001157 [Batrachochytrium salamandrivorans]|nr:hypothetical protein BASA60_003626 [Batrachochytrium salamandrivorans]KAH9260496.1 hypothetical protein BASA82_001157 [Batrachochytrium salamandrivorans]
MSLGRSQHTQEGISDRRSLARRPPYQQDAERKETQSVLGRAQAMIHASLDGSRSLGGIARSISAGRSTSRHAATDPISDPKNRHQRLVSNDASTDGFGGRMDFSEFTRQDHIIQSKKPDDDEDGELKAYLAALKKKWPVAGANASISAARSSSATQPNKPILSATDIGTTSTKQSNQAAKLAYASEPSTSLYLKKQPISVFTPAPVMVDKDNLVGDIESDTDSINVGNPKGNSYIKASAQVPNAIKRIDPGNAGRSKLTAPDNRVALGYATDMISKRIASSTKDLASIDSQPHDSTDSVGSDFDAFLNMRLEGDAPVVASIPKHDKFVAPQAMALSVISDKENPPPVAAASYVRTRTSTPLIAITSDVLPHRTLSHGSPQQPLLSTSLFSQSIQARNSKDGAANITNQTYLTKLDMPQDTSLDISDDIAEEFEMCDDESDVLEDILPTVPITVVPSTGGILSTTSPYGLSHVSVSKPNDLTLTVLPISSTDKERPSTSATTTSTAQAHNINLPIGSMQKSPLISSTMHLDHAQIYKGDDDAIKLEGVKLQPTYQTIPSEHTPFPVQQSHIPTFPHHFSQQSPQPPFDSSAAPAGFPYLVCPGGWNPYAAMYGSFGFHNAYSATRHPCLPKPDTRSADCNGLHACGCSREPKLHQPRQKTQPKSEKRAATAALDTMCAMLEQAATESRPPNDVRENSEENREIPTSDRDEQSVDSSVTSPIKPSSTMKKEELKVSMDSTGDAPLGCPSMMVLDSFVSGHMDLLQDFVHMNMKMADSQTYRRMHYTTLDDVRTYTAKNRPPTMDIYEALRRVKEESGELSVGQPRA